MDFQNILLDIKEHVAVVTINRPESLNALNEATLLDLRQCMQALEKRQDVLAIIITGEGDRAFVAGADIAHMKALTVSEAKKFAELGHEVLKTIENMSRPVIAAVNGFALGGGCELALACDMRLASDNAQFGQPEVNLGVVPGFGGTQRLPRLIGKGLANEILFSGKMIDGDEAYRIGLVNRIVPQQSLMDECRQLAAIIATRGVRAVELCKQAVNNGLEMDLQRACGYEADLFALCFADKEQEEGMAAFLEKRKANFIKG